jgi:hypothetical protein
MSRWTGVLAAQVAWAADSLGSSGHFVQAAPPVALGGLLSESIALSWVWGSGVWVAGDRVIEFRPHLLFPVISLSHCIMRPGVPRAGVPVGQ